MNMEKNITFFCSGIFFVLFISLYLHINIVEYAMIEESGAAYPPTTNTNTRLEIALITPAKIVVLANSIVLLSAIYTTLYKLISILKSAA